MRFEASVNIMDSAEAIWDAVADPVTWPNWTDTISKVNKLTKEPLDVGSKLHITVRIVIPIRLFMTITEFVHRKKVTIKGNILFGNMTR